jgi:hypothetical protein
MPDNLQTHKRSSSGVGDTGMEPVTSSVSRFTTGYNRPCARGWASDLVSWSSMFGAGALKFVS